MKTVWLVSKGWEYEGADVHGVYSTKERAIAVRDALIKEGGYDFVIETEYTIDDTKL